MTSQRWTFGFGSLTCLLTLHSRSSKTILPIMAYCRHCAPDSMVQCLGAKGMFRVTHDSRWDLVEEYSCMKSNPLCLWSESSDHDRGRDPCGCKCVLALLHH